MRLLLFLILFIASIYSANSKTVFHLPTQSDTFKTWIFFDSDSALVNLDKYAEFDGGNKELMLFIVHNLRYPDEAREAVIQGKIYLQFKVEANGNVSDIRILRGVHSSLEAEAIRIIKLTSGKWHPAVYKGKKVCVRFSLPINFKLQ